jgi:TPR repeat protein
MLAKKPNSKIIPFIPMNRGVITSAALEEAAAATRAVKTEQRGQQTASASATLAAAPSSIPATSSATEKDTKAPATSEKKEFNFADCLKKANEGNIQAQRNIGVCYENGINGVSKDPELAIYWYCRVLQPRSANAAELDDKKIEKDKKTKEEVKKKLLNLLKQQADAGSALAQVMLGFCYSPGNYFPNKDIIVVKDEKQAFKYLADAVKQDSVAAKCFLSLLYLDNYNSPTEIEITPPVISLKKYSIDEKGFPAGFQCGFSWLIVAAEAGYREAQFTLADFYERGFTFGGKMNCLRLANAWYQKAAEQKHAAFSELLKSDVLLTAESKEKIKNEKLKDKNIIDVLIELQLQNEVLAKRIQACVVGVIIPVKPKPAASATAVASAEEKAEAKAVQDKKDKLAREAATKKLEQEREAQKRAVEEKRNAEEKLKQEAVEKDSKVKMISEEIGKIEADLKNVQDKRSEIPKNQRKKWSNMAAAIEVAEIAIKATKEAVKAANNLLGGDWKKAIEVAEEKVKKAREKIAEADKEVKKAIAARKEIEIKESVTAKKTVEKVKPASAIVTSPVSEETDAKSVQQEEAVPPKIVVAAPIRRTVEAVVTETFHSPSTVTAVPAAGLDAKRDEQKGTGNKKRGGRRGGKKYHKKDQLEKEKITQAAIFTSASQTVSQPATVMPSVSSVSATRNIKYSASAVAPQPTLPQLQQSRSLPTTAATIGTTVTTTALVTSTSASTQSSAVRSFTASVLPAPEANHVAVSVPARSVADIQAEYAQVERQLAEVTKRIEEEKIKSTYVQSLKKQQEKARRLKEELARALSSIAELSKLSRGVPQNSQPSSLSASPPTMAVSEYALPPFYSSPVKMLVPVVPPTQVLSSPQPMQSATAASGLPTFTQQPRI